MKIRHIYTVVREFSIEEKDLDEEIESFGGIEDKAGEYLYGGVGPEKIKVVMEVSRDGKEWKKI